MNSPRLPKPSERPDRTRFITMASIVAVGVAGATAVSANIGILDAASDSNVGNLSAVGDVTPATQVIDVYLPGDVQGATTSVAVLPVAAGTSVAQEFAVDVAGMVSIVSTGTGIQLESVAPNAGWSWKLTQGSEASLMVTMSNGVRTLEFTATLMADGSIAAVLNEPTLAAPPTVNTRPRTDDDDDEEDDEEEDDEEEDDEDEPEYEGSEDDD